MVHFSFSLNIKERPTNETTLPGYLVIKTRNKTYRAVDGTIDNALALREIMPDSVLPISEMVMNGQPIQLPRYDDMVVDLIPDPASSPSFFSLTLDSEEVSKNGFQFLFGFLRYRTFLRGTAPIGTPITPASVPKDYAFPVDERVKLPSRTIAEVIAELDKSQDDKVVHLHVDFYLSNHGVSRTEVVVSVRPLESYSDNLTSNVYQPTETFSHLTNPLHLAATTGNASIIQRIRSTAGVLLNLNSIQMQDGATAIALAAERGHLDVLRELFPPATPAEAKAMSLSRDRMRLSSADSSIVFAYKARLKDQESVINIPLHSGETPLFLAARKGHLKVVQWLLRNGADINAATPGGVTPLAIAEQRGHTAIVETLKPAETFSEKNPIPAPTPPVMRPRNELFTRAAPVSGNSDGDDAEIHDDDDDGLHVKRPY